MGSKTTKTTSTSKPTVTSGLQDIYNMIGSYAREISGNDLEANPFARVADLTQDEIDAFQLVRDNIGVGKEAIDAGVAAQVEALAKSGRAPTQAELQDYMNPFTETVINRAIEKQQEDADRGFINIGSNAALSKAFGGSRQALLEAELMRNLNKNIGDTYYTGMKDNYDTSLATYLGQIDRLSQNAGRSIAAGTQQQAYGLTDAAALENIGRTQRQRLDADLQLKSEDFLRLQDEKYKDLQAMIAAAGGISPGSIGQNTKQVTKESGDPLSALLGLASTAAGLMTGSPGSGSGLAKQMELQQQNMHNSNVANGIGSILGNLPAFRVWKKGGRVKKYAYGGRVGNSFSQGESSDVIRATQNPFKNSRFINNNGAVPGGMPSDFILGGDMGTGGPAIVDITGGFQPPVQNPFTFIDEVGGPAELPSVGFNAGALSTDLMNPASTGGNPVANLLDRYKSGVRNTSEFQAPRPSTYDGGYIQAYAGGGAVKSTPTEGNGTIMNPFDTAVFMAKGGRVPKTGYADGGMVFGGENKVRDQLFSPEGLLMMGLQILANSSKPVGEALGQGALGTIGYFDKQNADATDPLALLKLETQRLRNEDLQARMDDRLVDNDRSDRHFYERMAAQDARDQARFDQQWARDEARFAQQDERDARRAEAAANKPEKFSYNNYPGLIDDVKLFKNASGNVGSAKYEDVDLDELANNIETYANQILDEGYEDQAVRLMQPVETYRKNITNKRKKLADEIGTMLNPFTMGR